MNLLKTLLKAEVELQRELSRIEKELAGVRTAIAALSGGKKSGGKRGRPPGIKLSPATISKMKTAQRKRRASEKKGEKKEQG